MTWLEQVKKETDTEEPSKFKPRNNERGQTRRLRKRKQIFNVEMYEDESSSTMEDDDGLSEWEHLSDFVDPSF